MTVHLEYFKADDFIAKIIRTDRIKTVSVKVEEGQVSIVIPQDLSETRIKELVTKKTRWIREKILLHSKSIPSKFKEYVAGESFTYLGKNYRLQIETGIAIPVKLSNGRLRLTLPSGTATPEIVKNKLTGWYRAHAEIKLREKVARYASIVGVSPKSVGIKTFKSRWGSCHANGNIEFNWKIIIAPNRIVDYVVVHELCHMKQHNHSPKFWKCVEKIIPDYIECRQWLKNNGKELII